MVTAAAAGTDAALPVVYVVSVEELKRNAGKAWRDLAAGAVIRIDDARLGQTVGWLSAEVPASVAHLVPFMPEPGTAADRLAPDSEV